MLISQDYPLISVITPTWQRNDLLLETIEEVGKQTYPNLEHIIVVEGPDEELRQYFEHNDPTAVPTYVYYCGRNWSSFLKDSVCVPPTLVGTFMAHGQYHTWLVDDERPDPRHIELLYEALIKEDADFAYSKVLMWIKDNPGHRWVIGGDTPEYGQITNCLYNIRVLDKGVHRLQAGRKSDWDLINRWMKNGAKWAFVPEVTLVHRADK